MRTELELEYIKENNLDENAVGLELIFTYQRYKNWVRRKTEDTSDKELNTGGNQKMQEELETTQTSENSHNTVTELGEEAVNIPDSVQPAEMPETPTGITTIATPVDPVTDAAPSEPTAPVSEFDALDTSGQIEKKKFDPTPFIGLDSFIEHIEERKGQYGFYIKLLSRVVDDNERFEIRASAIFGLETDEEGKLGWPPESKLDNFLKKHKVAHYRELIGNPMTQVLKDDKGESFRRISGIPKTAIKIQTRQGKDGKEYLTF